MTLSLVDMARQRKRRPVINVIERILRHSPRQADGECWITDYAQSVGGYRSISLDGSYKDGDRMYRRMHRVAWEAHNAEPIPEGMIVRHTCDNPACINPEHLVLGTHKQNTADMIERGRAGWQTFAG